VCPAGVSGTSPSSCAGGKCQYTCNATADTYCPGTAGGDGGAPAYCADLQNDDHNCGKCGETCGGTAPACEMTGCVTAQCAYVADPSQNGNTQSSVCGTLTCENGVEKASNEPTSPTQCLSAAGGPGICANGSCDPILAGCVPGSDTFTNDAGQQIGPPSGGSCQCVGNVLTVVPGNAMYSLTCGTCEKVTLGAQSALFCVQY